MQVCKSGLEIELFNVPKLGGLGRIRGQANDRRAGQRDLVALKERQHRQPLGENALRLDLGSGVRCASRKGLQRRQAGGVVLVVKESGDVGPVPAARAGYLAGARMQDPDAVDELEGRYSPGGDRLDGPETPTGP